VIAGVVDGVCIFDQGFCATFQNPAFKALFPNAARYSAPLSDFFTDAEDLMPEVVGALVKYGQWQDDVWESDDRGHERCMEWRINRITHGPEDTTYYVALISDVTSQKKTETRLRKLAYYDELTGVMNRRHFTERVQSELRRCARYDLPGAMMMIDLDLFKDVNDTYGHATGDKVLQGFARICSDILREHDAIGRMGGEEFAVFMPHVEPAQMYETAERMRMRVKQAIFTGPEEQNIFVTVSIGVADVRKTHYDFNGALALADAALYQAKRNGRNQVVVSP
jgi:diguanylate cyclase (GGDEF)-like protein